LFHYSLTFRDKKMERHRQIIYFKDYFLDFFDQQTEKVKEKLTMFCLS